ncbi:hypothetical protein [Litchfieldia salsa]|uniref:Uncharacterized protein n=1 Tax=Litchfieldia salsa TaxID=930152 RepID=A0A1H0T0D0_9BACI|nr:hypothetical protein [Litchfieldia salsa]SDP47066.1 hypothetical protein SAMN05216565_103199 [Litchfieldia salsa]
MSIILRRKILTAIVSSLLFALIFSLPGGFDMNAFATLYYLNVMIVVTYGVITSILSDWFSKLISQTSITREITSFVFHCLFGFILGVLGLGSAISFFIIDRLLTKVKIRWWHVILGILIVVLIFIIALNIG